MTLRRIIASVNVFALGIGLGAAFARGRALQGSLDKSGLQRVPLADSFLGAFSDPLDLDRSNSCVFQF